MPSDSSTTSRRQVPVPMPMYKIVTVFTTLIALGAVVLGLVLIDRGTDRATVAAEDVNLLVTGTGVALILIAAGIYAFSTRFTPPQRANDKGTSTEAGDENG